MLNDNARLVDRNYFERERYQAVFREIFDELRRQGLFRHSVKEIENSDLFKLSPFKVLSDDQADAVLHILQGLFEDLQAGLGSSSGDPGTGKTLVGIFLIKLLRDIQTADLGGEFYEESVFADFFLPDYARLLNGLRIGLVVPQQSLRDSIRKVFARTPKLDRAMVLSAFDVGLSADHYDLLIVDETHRLNQRANQSSGIKNQQFAAINSDLFGTDELTLTQLDWIQAKSKHQIFLLDSAQSVRPADLLAGTAAALVHMAGEAGRLYPLNSQMRVQAGSDYVGTSAACFEANPWSLDPSATTSSACSMTSGRCAKRSLNATRFTAWRGWSPAMPGHGPARRTSRPTTSRLTAATCAGTAPRRTGSTPRGLSTRLARSIQCRGTTSTTPA